jgi:hypothetical protein
MAEPTFTPIEDTPKDITFTPIEDTPAPVKYGPKAQVGIGDVVRGVVDTGLLDMIPGGRALQEKFGRPGARSPKDVVLNPQGVGEQAASMAVKAPMLAGGGALAKAAGAAPLVGEALTAGTMGAAEQGRNPLAGFLIDAAVTAITGGAVKGIDTGIKIPGMGKVEGLAERGAAARGYEYAKGLPQKALDFIENRLPKRAILRVPTISSEPITPQAAIKKLSELEGIAYKQARSEIADEFNRIEIQRFAATPSGTVKIPRSGTSAGQRFLDETKESIFSPPASAKAAEALRAVTTSPLARAAVEALGVDPISPGVPLGGLAGIAAGEAGMGGLRHLKEAVAR